MGKKVQPIQGRRCVSPGIVDGVEVRCRKCPQCRAAYTDAWVLACMAEGQSGVKMWAVTLTYRPGELGENFLKYSDVQDAFKRVRFHGYGFRYLVAGELGGAKGRPHWHALIFWDDEPPEKGELLNPQDAGSLTIPPRWNWRFWPHGHSHIDEGVEPQFARYVCKYAQKAESGANFFVMSRKPGLGMEYFDEHARRHAANRSIVPGNVFTVSGFDGALSPARWKRYRQTFYEAWQEIHGDADVLMAWEAFENIMLDDERAEWEAASDAVKMADVKLPEARDWQTWHVKLSYLDNEKSGGAPSVQRLSTYQRDGVRFMRLEHDGKKKWLIGKFHLPGLAKNIINAQSGKTARKVDIPISPQQFWDIRHGKRPMPENDPFAQSDWITNQAAKVRLERGLRSVSSVVRRASAKPNYRTPKKKAAHS
ncbi:MAG: hypothetical protein LC676_08400 [Loktanella sp.]|nr:hypothetical protein [Loktanella sp.]